MIWNKCNRNSLYTFVYIFLLMVKALQILPGDVFDRLEFNKFLEWAGSYCMAEPGREMLLNATPAIDHTQIVRILDEVNEVLSYISSGGSLPLSEYQDIRGLMPMLRIQDSVLPIEDVLSIRHLVGIIAGFHELFTSDEAVKYPRLKSIVEAWDYDPSLLDFMDSYLDEEGEIKEDASPDLKRIRKSIRSKAREADRVFHDVMKKLRSTGSLAESPESTRNGRRVLAVLAEHKRQVKGIIHDESSSGKTVFIEPEAVIPVNNDLIDLAAEERREIYRILKDVCNEIRFHIDKLPVYLHGVIYIDAIQARVNASRQYGGIVPDIKDKSMFKLYQARHPLLLLKNNKENKVTVPFNYHLHQPNRLMILSGPNAGGKSVTMKAVGLLQLMVQSGFPVPVGDGTEMGVFHKFFADIGDQQSLEDDLSTYSSRLKNMKDFLGSSDERTMVLIDEFGTGTDPKFGGALAESILYALNKIGVYGIITTHYSNLKQFAYKHKGLLNGSMNFDRKNLTPTYELVVGKPGSSFTFEIAQKVGLPGKVLEAARKKAGSEAVSFDELLIKLQEEKAVLEGRISALEEKEKAADKLIRNYQQMANELQVQRKKFKMEVKASQLHDESRRAREIERYLRELREKESLKAAEEAVRKAKQEKQELAQEIDKLRQEVLPQNTEKLREKLKVGASVKLVHGGQTGEILQMDKKKAEVLVGALRISVPVNELVPIEGFIEPVKGRGVQARLLEAHAKFERKLDVRGMRREEVMKLMETYLDEAMLAGARNCEIVHGKGNGILRKAVHQALKSYPHALKFHHPEDESGGSGVTLVDIE